MYTCYTIQSYASSSFGARKQRRLKAPSPDSCVVSKISRNLKPVYMRNAVYGMQDLDDDSDEDINVILRSIRPVKHSIDANRASSANIIEAPQKKIQPAEVAIQRHNVPDIQETYDVESSACSSSDMPHIGQDPHSSASASAARAGLVPQSGFSSAARAPARKRSASASPRNVRAAFQSFKHFLQLAERCNADEGLRLASLVAASMPPPAATFRCLHRAMDITSTGRVEVRAAPAASDDVTQHQVSARIFALMLQDTQRMAPSAAASAALAPSSAAASNGTSAFLAAGGQGTLPSTSPLHSSAASGYQLTPPRDASQESASPVGASTTLSYCSDSSALVALHDSSADGVGGVARGGGAVSALQLQDAAPALFPCCMQCSQQVPLDKRAPLECGHVVCHTCVQSIVAEAVQGGGTQGLQCLLADCGKRWLPQHITPCLPPAAAAAYEQCMIQEALGGGGGSSQGGGELFVTCPHEGCGHRMLMEQQSLANARSAANSAILAGTRNSNGSAISFAALLHKELHRLRCAGCSNSFCTKCNAAPYHLGRTCEQHAVFQCAAKCRFCGEALDAGAADGGGAADVCSSDECKQRWADACKHTLPCGHACGGVHNELVHLPCLQLQCIEAAGAGTVQRDTPPAIGRPRRGRNRASAEEGKKQAALQSLLSLAPPISNGDDYCTICYVEGLSAAPSVQLLCGHVLHWQCVQKKINGSWSGARITFGFLNCPQCQQLMKHPLLDALPEYQDAMSVKVSLEEKALQRLKFENLEKAPEIIKAGGQFFNKPLEYAMHRFAYYPCFKCKKPYFGGMRACGAPAAVGADGSFKREELVCGSCRPDAKGVSTCSTHGKEFVQRKCRFCCSPAVWFCWGTTSFCEPCHFTHNKTGLAGKPQSSFKQCKGASSCSLRMKHPPNGGTEEFSMGCGICGTEQKVASGGGF